MDPVSKKEGPCVILAGPGSGKTFTIVEKVKNLISNGVYEPEKIVCLTFSNEAVNSLKSRIISSLKEEKEPIIRTFHSFCSDLLKAHGETIGVKENFRILLPDDAKILIHKNLRIQPRLCSQYINSIGIAKDLGIETETLEKHLEKKLKDLNMEDLEKTLENLKFELQTLHLGKEKYEISEKKRELEERINKIDNILKTKKFLNVWKAYEKLKEKKNLQDYSDLNKKALLLLEKKPEIANAYDYIIVDEFQDTNKLQCDFLRLLANHRNITIVGDLNQSIYRFRGAYKDNLESFKKALYVKESDIFNLDKSFRSTNKILSLSHNLILNNYKNKEESFPVYNAFNEEGENIKVFELENNKEEVRKVIEIIKDEIKRGTKLEEICVQFRTHQQSRSLKNSLEYEKIPFISVTKKSLFKTLPIKQTLDYLTILNKIKGKGKGGEQAWWDLIFNSNFSKEDAISISRYIKENKESDCLSIKLINSHDSIALTEKGKIKLSLLIKKIKSLIPETNRKVPELILKIYETAGLNQSENESEIKDSLLVLKKFHSLALDYSDIDSPDLGSFINHLEIMNSLGIEVETPVIEEKGIRIMTNHATKGLEYEVVIVTNLAQKKFPLENIKTTLIPPEVSPEIASSISNLSEDEAEEMIRRFEKENQLLEERRLCYVAFTRTKKRLYLTYSKKYNNRKAFPSQFLKEINYKSDKNIEFIEDKKESYKEPELRLDTAANINSFLKHEKPEEIMKDNRETKKVFSPSSLQIFSECNKKYEYKYVYNMPEPIPVSWDSINIGSFCHLVFEMGVSQKLKSEKEFIDLAKTLHMEDKWNFIEISEAMPLIKVFFHRNKEKLKRKSLTEKKLFVELEGIKFMGIADRIDISDSGELEIIDYKTGNSDIKPRYRNWQLGLYALASKKFGIPRKLTLDMLKKEKPIEFELDTQGNATEIHSKRTSFSLDEVRQDLISTAREIEKCFSLGFPPCPIEKNCDFCNEYVYT